MAATAYKPSNSLLPGDEMLRRRYLAGRWLRYLALAFVVILALILLIPIVWMILGSFKIQRVALAYPPEIIPSNPVMDNWERLLIGRPSMRWLLNSLVVAGGIAIFGVITSTCAGYAFGKKDFPGRTIFFWMILMTMMLPRQIYIIPLFVLMKSLGWFNSYQGMIAPYIVYPFGVFLMRQYMQSIPDELLEAAKMDGASELQLFRHIVVPLSRPAIGAIAIFAFMAGWNDYLWQLVLATDELWLTLPVGVAKLTASGVGSIDIGVSMAGATFAVIPMLLIFLLFQNYFIKGITVGALKG
ncbi:MAG: carbohydrate ABC transporter permease [Chloroflexi bacterium]|nr:carbohydrate ABC transporter permease [Chloroflexota bacterium]MCY3581385.1 carbohydrate ABC transporter permease [Chloroflexota bacterium]MCY3717530.1 carbohydrate ABC transporter permease [Chloroflexota bacterium]MDE2651961.1 carbohydrate ABC transporter permease [Chloroflexota bacterium]